MNILAFSMSPLFEEHAMGGAQIQLKKVALHLAELGHEVLILCTRRDAHAQPFQWHERVRVNPLLRFKQPYPEPYATSPYNIANAIQDVAEHLRWADRYYSHDGGLIFPYVYQFQDKPTVISYRSVLFAETLQSGFLFQGDALIVPSNYARAVWVSTAGRFFPGYGERVRAIYNGINWDVFKPTAPTDVLDYLPGIDPERHALVLYPHRPEGPKGIHETIAVTDLLVNRYGLGHVRVLVPRWIESALSAADREFYEALTADITRRGLSEHFVYHDWLPEYLLPQYYSLGAVTLVAGSYVETFGNVAYESLGCGTLAILARVGPARELLPDDLVYKVDYGDVETAAEIAARIIHEKQRTKPETMAYLHEHFQQADMVAQYADTILNAERQPALDYHVEPTGEQTRFALAPWCYVSERGVYHDFLATFIEDRDLVILTAEYPAGFTFADARRYHRAEGDVMAWYRDGYVVPQHGAEAR